MEDEQNDIVEELDKDIDILSKVTFLDSLLDKQTEIRNMLDVRSNIVIGFNSALIVLIVSFMKESVATSPLLWLVLAVLITSLLLSIIALKPPHVHTKKGQHESLFYHHYINSMGMEDYRSEIHKVLTDEKKIYDAYITEVYNMTRYSNVPRKVYLYSSIKVLIYGVAAIVFFYGIWYLYSVM